MPTITTPTKSDSNHIRSEESFKHAKEISKALGQVDLIIEWCKRELNHEWRWQLVEISGYERPGRYIFYFDDDKDYFAFTMKWA